MAEIRVYQCETVDVEIDGVMEQKFTSVKVFAPFDYDKFIACLERYRKEVERAGDNPINSILERAVSEATGNVDILGKPLGYCEIEFFPIK